MCLSGKQYMKGSEFYPRKKWVGQNLVTVENTYRDIFID